MFARGKKTETAIPVKLEEPLTSEGCLKLIVELLKYLLYNKQQIPFSYDCLSQVQSKSKPNDRNFLNIQKFFDSLCDVTEHLNSQFYTARCNVREVVIIIGATIFSPKICIRVELPEQILDSKLHTEYYHSSRKPLLHLMRSMLECDEFQDAMTMPLGPTNTFVLVQKSDSNQMSEFFIPKPQYALPVQAPCFRIRIDNCGNIQTNCHCPSAITVFHDSRSEYHIESNHSNILSESNECKASAPYQWYQSTEVIKGFKFLR